MSCRARAELSQRVNEHEQSCVQCVRERGRETALLVGYVVLTLILTLAFGAITGVLK